MKSDLNPYKVDPATVALVVSILRQRFGERPQSTGVDPGTAGTTRWRWPHG